MNNIIYLFLILFLITGCSLNKNSKFWTASKEIKLEKNFEEVLIKQEVFNKQFNANILINLKDNFNNDLISYDHLNNYGRVEFNSDLKKSSRYKFSKIKNFHQYEPELSFYNNKIIFFDNKGTILKFDDNSKLIWKKNYYSKQEKKLNPILQFANNEKYLIVADNIAKYYLLDLESGDLIWEKSNLAPFNSQIKIYKDKFFVTDFSNTLRCFSLKNGDEIWSIKTEDSLIRSQKKLSMIIHESKIYFNNSIGDISAVDINRGELIWQLPTQSTNIYQSSFSLESSDLISDGKSLFFSNNKNQIFSIDIKSGNFNWENKINSNVRPVLVDNLLFTVSMEGYLAIIEKNSGKIIKLTYIFDKFKDKIRKKIKPIGFLVGAKNIYLSTNNGRILIIDISTGKTISILKIDNEKISRPFIMKNKFFVIKDNAVIKLD